ncbi:MAG TPA: DUF2807 domain-containing protein [Cyclobacteriaceae bacterium]|nr:DUF2807 domain-containing protein [Cyclobacteriaceae bacterium]
MKVSLLKAFIVFCVAAFAAIVLWFNLFVRSEIKRVGPYESISVDGPIQVFLVSGLRDSIRIVADENLLPIVAANVKTKNLVLGVTGEVVHERVLKVYASLENLKKIHLSGASTLDVAGTLVGDTIALLLDGAAEGRIKVACGAIKVEMHDAANIFLAGLTDLFELKVYDVSDIVAYNLLAKRCEILVKASRQSPGILRVSVSDTLEVRMKGQSGRVVYYKGEPTVFQDIDGEGQVVAR